MTAPTFSELFDRIAALDGAQAFRVLVRLNTRGDDATRAALAAVLDSLDGER